MNDDVCTYLADQISELTFGKNLTSGHMPKNPAFCVTVFGSGGAGPYQELSVDKPTCQVVVRGAQSEYDRAEAMALQIYNLLNRKLNITIGTKDVMQAQAIAYPQALDLTDKRQWEFVTNYQFQVRNS